MLQMAKENTKKKEVIESFGAKRQFIKNEHTVRKM